VRGGKGMGRGRKNVPGRRLCTFAEPVQQMDGGSDRGSRLLND